ncbi:restriction endonuclease [Sinomonas halotolerans]|uniref:Restriction endonuclease n=1 Tax=Sinomonas halotolerans TaxID=1644133 RepID=A0ABU9WW01_9MICC
MNRLLSQDPRTMWAWSEYENSDLALPVDDNAARQVLEAIPEGDHVEVFGAVTVGKQSDWRATSIPEDAYFAARAFNAWIIPSRGWRPLVIPASTTRHTANVHGPQLSQGSFRVDSGGELCAYGDHQAVEWFDQGAGSSILRLPDSPAAPTPPSLGGGAAGTSTAGLGGRAGLLGDWRTAEDVARWHMSGPLGFFGARLTGGVSDRGVDVEHPEAAAQVKMQATPVGAPQIRQLRGTRPQLGAHLFYSTSGYTSAALEEAAETGVALFAVGDDARVLPVGGRAEALVLDGHRRRGGDDAVVAAYVQEVTSRIGRAARNHASPESIDHLRRVHGKDRAHRAIRYLVGAMEALEEAPAIGGAPHREVLGHFRNADLRAAFSCTALGLPYPGDRPAVEAPKRRTAADFY